MLPLLFYVGLWRDLFCKMALMTRPLAGFAAPCYPDQNAKGCNKAVQITVQPKVLTTRDMS